MMSKRHMLLLATWLLGCAQSGTDSYSRTSSSSSNMVDPYHASQALAIKPASSAAAEPGQKALCSKAFMARLTAPATAAEPSIELSCSAVLPRGAGSAPAVLTKAIIIAGQAGTGVTLDCNGAVLEPAPFAQSQKIWIKSVQAPDPAMGATSWQRPENVTVKNCTVYGSVRVEGMARNGEGKFLRASSRQDAQHTQRAQANAPRNIVLDNLDLRPNSQTALYVAPGVTQLRLTRSRITGTSASVAIYLDAESAHNVLKNNVIATATASRELIAVDGSAYNLIIGNRFAHLEHGGIYLYRNCGEGGTIRHQAPVGNHIINNVFQYVNNDGGNPAIWLASRNGDRGYCDADMGYSWGSSRDDEDFARHNVVMQNQVVKNAVAEVFRVDDAPNLLRDNSTVAQARARKSGCYLGGSGVFIGDAAVLPAASEEERHGTTAGRGICADGEIVISFAARQQ